LAASTDAEIAERIYESMTSYLTESNEDTFKPDTVCDHQAKIPISDRALFVGFLMLWLKRCILPTLPHEVIVANMVYPIVLLVHTRPLILLSAMVGFLQSGLRILYQSLCNIVVEEDREGNVVVGPNGKPMMKRPNPRVELPYIYLMAWYVMHSASLMPAVQSFEDACRLFSG